MIANRKGLVRTEVCFSKANGTFWNVKFIAMPV